MLHVFAVNDGHLLTYDVTCAMKRVGELKSLISSNKEISKSKQVMLINDGEALDDDVNVCNYKAGTENNPIFLFDKSLIEKQCYAISNKGKSKPKTNFNADITSSLRLPPCYATVASRTRLALQIHEATRDQVNNMEKLVQDEHLMYRGWIIAVKNLKETLSGFEQRTNMANHACSILLEKLMKDSHVLQQVTDVIGDLGRLPVFATLQSTSISETKNTMLLEWIESQCHDIKIQDVIKDCQDKIYQLTKDKLSALVDDCYKVLEQGSNSRMIEISGINERLAALDQVIVAAKQHIVEQKGIAQGFVRNQETAQDLPDVPINRDALLTLCESHVTQLQIMQANESATHEGMRKCETAKLELAQNLHTRLRWLYFVQRTILNADVKLSMFREQLNQLCNQMEFLSQVHQAPDIYLSLVRECVRRHSFSQKFSQWSDEVLTSFKVVRDREIFRRKSFKHKIGNHFVQKLFPGLSDRPPVISRKPLRKFDLHIPSISGQDMESLKVLFPDNNMLELADEKMR